VTISGAGLTRPIHLCHVFSSFEPGGPEVRAATLINLLGSRYEHTIIAADGKYGTANRISGGSRVQYIPPPPGKGSVLYGLTLLPLLRSIAPQVVATYNWGAIDAVVASRLARRWPVIHSEDGFGVDELTALKRRRVLARRLLLRGAYATLVPSTTLLRIATVEYRIPRERVILIRNGVDTTVFRPGRAFEWRRAAGIPDDAIVIGTVGALRAEKHVSFLLEAFAAASIPGARLLVVGDGPCRGELEAQALRLGVSDRVFFVGTTNNPVEYYQATDVFTLSSLTEQMPISLLEAMACGLPVVATSVGDVPNMLTDEQRRMLVQPRDVAAYARALADLAGDASLRASLGAGNRCRAETTYPLTRMVECYDRLYSAAAAGRPLTMVPNV
jgi:glycosyltransferase involved in cell wall biosynthesis